MSTDRPLTVATLPAPWEPAPPSPAAERAFGEPPADPPVPETGQGESLELGDDPFVRRLRQVLKAGREDAGERIGIDAYLSLRARLLAEAEVRQVGQGHP